MKRPQLMVHNGIVLVSLGEEGIAAHNSSTGEQLWKTRLQADFLACVGSHLWCYDIQNRITAIRLSDGAEDAWLCPGPFTIPVINRFSERIILASPRGLLASLRPRVVASENTGIQPSAPSSNTNDNSSDSKQSSVSETSEKSPLLRTLKNLQPKSRCRKKKISRLIFRKIEIFPTRV